VDLVDDPGDLLVVVVGGADHADGGVEAIGVGDLGGVEVLHAGAGGAVHQVVGGVLVRPGGVSTGGAHHLEQGIGPNELVRVDGPAVALGVELAGQPGRIDRVQRDLAGLVDVDGLVEDHGVAGAARTARVGRVEHGPVVADVVEDAVADRRAAGGEGEQARE
jgi:hypothetical protein